MHACAHPSIQQTGRFIHTRYMDIDPTDLPTGTISQFPCYFHFRLCSSASSIKFPPHYEVHFRFRFRFLLPTMMRLSDMRFLVLQHPQPPASSPFQQACLLSRFLSHPRARYPFLSKHTRPPTHTLVPPLAAQRRSIKDTISNVPPPTSLA
ncbi:hypothetical protein BU24DRAFT_76258 [Aaosphaeria arxii CBS 175.79]|uniref:Uncharacterized protein n=1 Tax=Aaosphaeria arxii CBS 175.79 TaxID=1450172 RepID=A0A6A5X9C2_9PLEO|nr:uncharacterized protein BU24DRAFT_76258 [Aaosphaeria arxii CBS 175.79]KAF2009510.1 hypothetical protein BU24DRAFT_76258 [Aaosphaeria arxii CBS 175.79]